ncbi:MAG: hypothetical protein ACLFNR_01705 [Candidatus Paceibacterota bacterium]
MITFFESSSEDIKIEPMTGGWDRFLIIREAQRRNYDCELLVKKRKDKPELLYLRIRKREKTRWISPQRGYFNSKAACDLALYKHLTYKVLKYDGLPVPRFEHINKNFDLGKIDHFPVVVKPVIGEKGEDVVVKINNMGDLRKVCDRLFQKYNYILVEEMVFGKDHRLLVLGGEVIAALERRPPKVVGDGKRTILELIEKSNEGRKEEGDDISPYLKTLKIDEEMKRYINEQGHKPTSVLPKDEVVYLRGNANFTTGGEVEDITDKVCEENKKMAVKAVESLGLEFGGVDIITSDISDPLDKENGKIIEVNSNPGLWIHHLPHYGKPRNPAGKILDYLFEN